MPRSLYILAALIGPGTGVLAAQGTDALILNALRAAPPAVAQGATVVDGKHVVLRRGSNAWTCMPDDPAVPGDAPMCLDAPWFELVDALTNKRAPKIERVGVGYMLQGDFPVSNVDPYASGPTPENQWVADGPPHVMMVFPDSRTLDGLPTDPNAGGPWVMWKGTPYAHLMIPTAPRRR
ncbi:MAG TPA: hypothetical protein VKP10_18955 [Gemmatimonadales bacterium]|nr:hypothetical protein [Gemmatimonadales bacterium]